jgi:phosphoribosylaminoimidazole-succinocarboxamide synthase
MAPFQLPGQTHFYRGKVRDVYTIGDEMLVMIASDRISAFDVILPKTIPFKGQVLNQLAAYMLQQTSDICPNWWRSAPALLAIVASRLKLKWWFAETFADMRGAPIRKAPEFYAAP